MIRELIYIVEILSILKCIHCIYGEKLKNKIGYFATIVILWITVDFTNRYSVAFEGTLTMYGILIVYCIMVFGRSIKEIIINTALFMIIGTVIQMFFGMLVSTIYYGDVLVRTLIADVCVLAFNIFLLPRFRLDNLAKWLQKKNVVLYMSCGYVFLIIIQLLINIRIVEEVNIGFYFSIIPLIVCIYLLAKQWRIYQGFYEKEKHELQLYRKDKREFAGIISKVRSRQHEINNHLTAIMALHYTTDTYDELVDKQNEYCNHIISENRFNSLLGLYNSILPGYLIDKFTSIEEKEIAVECKVIVKEYEPKIPEYYLIEMLGILLDNAVEALEDSIYEKKLYFEIQQKETEFEYIVRNPYRYVPCEEIEGWFGYEKSSKGINRGIGLYHLKCLCAEWNCTPVCKNVKIDNTNWIEFRIKIGSKEH